MFLELKEGEELEYEARAHWIGYFWALLWVGVGVYVAFILKGFLVKLLLTKAKRMVVVGVPFSLAFYKTVSSFLNMRKTRLKVTNERVLVKYGLFWTKRISLARDEVQGVFVRKPFWGKILGFGTIYIVDKGGRQNSIKRISKPLKLLNQVIKKKSIELQNQQKNEFLKCSQ